MKKFVSLLVMVSFLISFSGCSAPQPKSDGSISAGFYPVTLTDHAGREVIIEEEPQRLVSCYYITTSLLMALDLDGKMVGIEDNPDFRPIYDRSNPQLLELTWVGTAKTLDLEGCAALQPDLVILPLRLKDAALLLEDLGIDVLLVNPESREQLTEMIQMVAKACNREKKAEELLAFLSAQESYLNAALADADAPKVYLSGNSNFLSTAGSAMYQADMISLAGGSNAAADIPDTYWAEIDYEQLLAWDPEYIILASSAKYTVEDVLNDPNLAACTAVRAGNVFQIPNDAESWDSPVPGSVLGAVWLAGILHPEKIPADICAGLMDEYYETFYGFTYTQN